MGRSSSCLVLLFAVAACRPPQHRPAPVPVSETPAISHEPRTAPSIVKVAVLEPTGPGNWAGTIALTPAPATLVAPCLAPGAAGWVSVRVETKTTEASTTDVVEASSDVSPDTRSCIANALKGVRKPDDAMQFLLYVTFSPE